jgi:DsbC/DsbD-like thiol-disulfide interchange protein
MEIELAKLGLSKRQLLVGAAAGCFGLYPVFALAQKHTRSKVMPSASPWSKASHSDLRLVANGKIAAGKIMSPGQYQAGIAVQMKPGFKTYWRHPGDSGVPPSFSFEGSENLARADILYQPPQKFPDGAGGYSFGYVSSDVIFPLVVTALDPLKPVLVRLKADYAVCDTICIPAHAQVSLTFFEPMDDHNSEMVRAAHANVPERVKLGQVARNLAIVALKKHTVPEQFLVEVKLPKELQADLFLEGESPWFFETKNLTRGDGDNATFVVSVIERSKAADCTGVDLTLTLVAMRDQTEKISLEVTTRLDLAVVTH